MRTGDVFLRHDELHNRTHQQCLQLGVEELAHLLEVGLDIGKPLFDAAFYVSASVTHITHNCGEPCRQLCTPEKMQAEKAHFFSRGMCRHRPRSRSSGMSVRENQLDQP